MLALDVVVERHVRKPRAIERRRRVGGRRRLPIAKQAHYDDEVFLRIECHSLADQPFVVFDLARVPLPGLRDFRFMTTNVLKSCTSRVLTYCWIDNDIVLGRRERPICIVRQEGPAQGLAFLEANVAQLEDLDLFTHRLGSSINWLKLLWHLP
jgi:hypothetical protein